MNILSRSIVRAACAMSAVLLAVSCSGGGGSEDDSGQPDPDPPATLDSAPTETIVGNAAYTVGSSVGAALDGATKDSGTSRILQSVQPNFAGLWNAETTRVISTSLALDDADGTIRDGNLITIDPDEMALCTDSPLSRALTRLRACAARPNDGLPQGRLIKVLRLL